MGMAAPPDNLAHRYAYSPSQASCSRVQFGAVRNIHDLRLQLFGP